MLFIAIFLIILAIIFFVLGVRASDTNMLVMGGVFLIGGIGAGLITYFALSAF